MATSFTSNLSSPAGEISAASHLIGGPLNGPINLHTTEESPISAVGEGIKTVVGALPKAVLTGVAGVLAKRRQEIEGTNNDAIEKVCKNIVAVINEKIVASSDPNDMRGNSSILITPKMLEPILRLSLSISSHDLYEKIQQTLQADGITCESMACDDDRITMDDYIGGYNYTLQFAFPE